MLFVYWEEGRRIAELSLAPICLIVISGCLDLAIYNEIVGRNNSTVDISWVFPAKTLSEREARGR